MKCANCDTEALYEYRITADKAHLFCGKHLPKFLEERRKAGALGITQKHSEVVAEALDVLKAVVEPPKPARKPKANASNS